MNPWKFKLVQSFRVNFPESLLWQAISSSSNWQAVLSLKLTPNKISFGLILFEMMTHKFFLRFCLKYIMALLQWSLMLFCGNMLVCFSKSSLYFSIFALRCAIFIIQQNSMAEIRSFLCDYVGERLPHADFILSQVRYVMLNNRKQFGLTTVWATLLTLWTFSSAKFCRDFANMTTFLVVHWSSHQMLDKLKLESF